MGDSPEAWMKVILPVVQNCGLEVGVRVKAGAVKNMEEEEEQGKEGKKARRQGGSHCCKKRNLTEQVWRHPASLSLGEKRTKGKLAKQNVVEMAAEGSVACRSQLSLSLVSDEDVLHATRPSPVLVPSQPRSHFPWPPSLNSASPHIIGFTINSLTIHAMSHFPCDGTYHSPTC